MKGQSNFRSPVLVFVKTDLLHKEGTRVLDFVGNLLGASYMMVTHNSDLGATDEILKQVGNLPKLLRWYGQNLQGGGKNSKTVTVPIGLENRRWGRMQPEYYTQTSGMEKTLLATANFRPRNDKRRALLKMLEAVDWVDTPGHGYLSAREADPSVSKHEAWLRDQARYKFSISPVGNGIDCHRTWEMVLIGVIPVLRSTIIDSVFESLRGEGAVVVVRDWSELNRTMLEDHWDKYGERIAQRRESWLRSADNVILASHWVREFKSVKESLPLHLDVAAVRQGMTFRGRRVHFRSYGDDNYAAAKSRIVNEAEATGWFATAKALGPEDLSDSFRTRFPDVLALPRGRGYWIWKYFVIENAMESMEEGDFLVYLDADCQVNKASDVGSTPCFIVFELICGVLTMPPSALGSHRALHISREGRRGSCSTSEWWKNLSMTWPDFNSVHSCASTNSQASEYSMRSTSPWTQTPTSLTARNTKGGFCSFERDLIIESG